MSPCSLVRPMRLVLIVAVFSLAVVARGFAEPPKAPEGQERTANQPAKPDIYDTKADAKALIAAAVEKAGRENQRVLVMFGGNWCGWCRKLHDLFKSDKDIAKTLLYEYQLVMVDVGHADKNMDIADKYGAEIKKPGAGVPYLVVLGADGKAMTTQETGPLEEGDHHNVKKVAEFLDKWKAEPQDADKVLSAALARAKKEEKMALVHLGAPWCPWCRKLDDFLARKDIAEIIGRDFIDVKIDVDRMTDGKTVASRLRKDESGGIPWFVFLDAEAKALATSDAADGNIGFPAKPEEIAHFMGMLKKTAKRITAEQQGQLEKALKDEAEKTKRPGAGERRDARPTPATPAQPSKP